MSTRVRVVCGSLALLVVAAAGTLVWMLQRDQPSYATSTYAEKDGSYTVGTVPDGGKGPVIAAVETMQHALGYDYRTLAKGLDAATSRMTEAFASEFTTTFRSVVTADAKDTKAVTVALVKAAGLIERDGNQAEALVFVDQVVLGNAEAESRDGLQRLVQSRVRVELRQVDGDWLVDGIEPVR